MSVRRTLLKQMRLIEQTNPINQIHPTLLVRRTREENL